MVKAIETRHEMYNAQMKYLAQRESSGDVLAIRPEAPLDLKHAEHDKEKLQKAYDTGYALGKKKLSEVKAFLGK